MGYARAHTEPVADRLPILIGITGKREFDPDPSVNDRLEAQVRERLLATFRALGKLLPHTPKLLLTGGAYGADTLGAEAALDAGDDWSVAVILPFDRELFEKDFRAPADASDVVRDRATKRLEGLRSLLARDDHSPARRVMVRVMPHLAGEHGGTIDRSRLDKDDPQQSAPLRHQHYEQVGQVIAESAMLLIAVTAGSVTASLTDADGSTARVIACRRAGRPDDIGTCVARRSRVLRKTWDDLRGPSPGCVWRLHAHADQDPVVTVLAPLRRPPGEVYADCLAEGTDAEDEPAHHVRRSAPASPGFPQGYETSVATIERLDEFHGLRDGWIAPRGVHRPASAYVCLSEQDPLTRLDRLRAFIRPVQAGVKQRTDAAFYMVSGFFVCAVASLEVFNEFFGESSPALLLYLVALVIVMLVIDWARRKGWQPRTEDFRAVSEMLRVQRAWWAAGLSDRVDRRHLQGAAWDLARVRDIGGAIIAWAWLCSPWQTTMPDDRNAQVVRDWVGEQIRYLARSHPQREHRASWMNAATWFIFATSVWLAALLWVWFVCPVVRDAANTLSQHPGSMWWPGLPPLVWIALGLACGALRVVWLHDVRAGSLWLTAGIGLVAAASLALGLLGIAVALSHTTAGELEREAVHKAIIVPSVILSAIAGALHFLNEKLGYEPEALAYREALDHFERAKRELASVTDPVSGEPTDMEHYGRIVRDLGILALRENETWLKARRERPLSVVLG